MEKAQRIAEHDTRPHWCADKQYCYLYSTLVHPPSIFMLSFLRYLPCLLLFLLLPARSHAAATPLAQVVSVLRDAGARHIFIGENHDDPSNIDTIASTLLGVTAGGKRASFWREMYVPPEHIGLFESRFKKFNQGQAGEQERDFPIRQVIGNVFNNSRASQVFREKNPAFSKIMTNGSVTYDMLIFLDPTRRDLSRFLAADSLAVSNTGWAHALVEYAGYNRLSKPWSGAASFPTIVEFEGPEFSAAAQEALWGGFRRALKAGPAIFIANRDAFMWAPDELDAIRIHYTSLGFGILKLPMRSVANAELGLAAKAYETFIFAPCSLVPAMDSIMQMKNRAKAMALYVNRTHPCHAGADKDEL